VQPHPWEVAEPPGIFWPSAEDVKTMTSDTDQMGGNGTRTQALRIPKGAWILVLAVIGLVLIGYARQRDDRRALTAAEARTEAASYGGTLLAATTMDTRSFLFIATPTEKRCQVSQIRDNSPRVFGGNRVLLTTAISGPVTVLGTWDPETGQERAVLCIALNDLTLQREVTRVQLILPDGRTTEARMAGTPNVILSLPSESQILAYTLHFFDATNTLLHTEQVK
jgi:hypothetical protein